MLALRVLFAIICTWQGTVQAAARRTYKIYPYDPSPFSRHLDISKEWNDNRAQWKDKVAPVNVLTRQAQLLDTLSSREPEWIDGYWLAADANFQAGNSYSDPKDFPTAKKLFLRGKGLAEKCLTIQSDNPLCKFYLGVNMGKIASIDGIFASLKNAKLVENLWTQVIDSPYNHQFGEKSSLQGAARYALGLFYRLVPDFFLMKWLFDVKGDIKKSVEYHKANLEFDSPNICSKVMLSVSLICSGGSTFSSPAGAEALKHLKDAKAMPVTSALYASCAKDIGRIEQNPKMACGYETSRQQETSEEEFKKQNAD